MYTPPYFAETDLALLDELALGFPFASLVTLGDGVPCISHLPILYGRDGSAITVRGHWSRANPQWQHGGDATLLLHGPSAYISPSWYPDKVEAARVPTWNYAVAHLSGPLEVIDDESGLADIVSGLTDVHEATVGSDWKFELENEQMRSQLRDIIGFRMQPTRIQLKFKMSQNHPETNVRSVAANLLRLGGHGPAVEELMLQRLLHDANGNET